MSLVGLEIHRWFLLPSTKQPRWYQVSLGRSRFCFHCVLCPRWWGCRKLADSSEEDKTGWRQSCWTERGPVPFSLIRNEVRPVKGRHSGS